jgi:hypothetical protein
MGRRAVLLITVIPLLAACGGGGAGTSTPTGLPLKATTLQAPPPQAADPEELVLNSDDLGAGWIPVPSQTKAISAAEALKGDPAALLKLERPAYRSGYQALYANPENLGVLATIYRYSSAAAARGIFAAGIRYTPKERGVKALGSPGGGPTGLRLFSASTKQEGHSVPAYVGMWQRGGDIATILVVGKGASAGQVVSLARKQDRRMALAAPPAA